MTKILIIGKKGFIGSYLKEHLSKYFNVKNYSIDDVLKKKKIFLKEYTHIINATIHKNYVKKKYNIKFDFDRNFINKFGDLKFKYIFFNSRKIYYPKLNINEKSKIKPQNIYAKNKIITENFLKKKLNKRLISLRISNIIGKRKYNSLRNSHVLFFDNFLKYRSKKKLVVLNEFKDFLSIQQFCKVMKKIISTDINGIYNISLSHKIYISEITRWLDKEFYKKIEFIKSKEDSFTLSNKKILKKINLKLTKKQLQLDCKKIII